MEKIKVFIRFDDVIKKDKYLEKLISLFIDNNITVNLGVVPTLVHKDTVAYLNKLKDKYPTLVDIDQHGYQHVRLGKGEFDINPDELFNRINNGREKMIKYFGDNFSEILTPPWHAHSNSLSKLAKKAGFKILSVNHRTDKNAKIFYNIGKTFKRESVLGHHVSYNFSAPQNGLFEVSPNLDVVLSYKGKGTLKKKEQILTELKELSRTHPVIGILIHPQHFRTDKSLNLISTIIDFLLKHKRYSFYKITDLAENSSSSNITQKKQEEYYNSNPYYFDHLEKKHGMEYFNQVLRLLDKVDTKYFKKSKILEVGSGSGNFVNILVKKGIPSNNIYAVDISAIGLKKHKNGIRVRANAKKLPFADNTFNICFTIDTLEHVLKYTNVIKELHRVTKPSGYIIFRTQNYDCPFLEFEGNDMTIYKKIVADRDAVSKTSATELHQTLKNLNGKIVSFETWASFNWKIPVLRLLNRVPVAQFKGGTVAAIFKKSSSKNLKDDLSDNSKVDFHCPKCKGDLNTKGNEYTCKKCNLTFKNKDQIFDFYI